MATTAIAPMADPNAAAASMGQTGVQPGDPSQAQGQQQPETMEHTTSSPMVGKPDEPQNSNNLTPPDQQKCIALVRRYKAQWQQDRMLIMQRCLENMEFFKGNQYVSFDPTSFQFFDAISWYQDEHPDEADDAELLRHCNNFYQMLATGFVAALSPQVPKGMFLPENAEVLEDVTTAKASQILIDVVERQNKIKSKLKQQLLYMFCCGAQFRHTRYLVDADIAGTHPEPTFGVIDTEIMPDRYHCFNCGTDNPAASMALVMSRQCFKCGAPLGPESFYPAVRGPMVQQTGTEDVPNGQVTWTVYSPLEVDCDPSAKELRQTPILNLSTEVHLAALRTSYPAMFKELSSASGAGLSANNSIDRLARSAIYSEAAYTNAQGLDMRPTLDRTWIQPWAFALEDDQDFVDRMTEMFPQGMLLINVNETFLEARQATLTKEWSWAGTHENFGLYPPAPGDVILPFQKRYNNIANIVDDYMERASAGITLGNTSLIDDRSLNGKQLLPGVINPVKLKNGSVAGNSLSEALFQFKFELSEITLEYLEKLMTNAQMFAGIPPQVYGGAGDPNVQTFGGQEQQLNVAMGKLNIYWDNLREEHAEADELAIKCAQDNLTDDLRQVVQERGSEYRNNYVRLDDLQGNVKAYPDTDQGFPISAAELRQRWMDLLKEATSNPVAQAIFDVPANQQQAATALGVPGMVIPGSAMSAKVYQILDKLQRSRPVPQQDPQTGTKTGQLLPSVMPDQEIDDFDTLRTTVRLYCQENADLAARNPQGWQNILLYLTQAKRMQVAYESEDQANKASVAKAGMPAPPPPPPKPQIPPDELNQVVGRLNDLMNMDPAQTNKNIQGQVAAAGQLEKIGTALMQ